MELPDAVARISASENLQVVVYQVVSPLFDTFWMLFSHFLFLSSLLFDQANN